MPKPVIAFEEASYPSKFHILVQFDETTFKATVVISLIVVAFLVST